nr:uncharacterized protein LOC112803462 [Arachis hypogaea]
MMVVREQTPSEALAIVPIQFFVPPSQQTTTDADSEPTPMLQIEGARETTPETPKQHQETTPKLPPAPTKIHPDAEDAAFGPKVSKQCVKGKRRKSKNSEGDWGRKFC